MLRKANYYLILENNNWYRLDFIRRFFVVVVRFLIDLQESNIEK